MWRCNLKRSAMYSVILSGLVLSPISSSFANECDSKENLGSALIGIFNSFWLDTEEPDVCLKTDISRDDLYSETAQADSEYRTLVRGFGTQSAEIDVLRGSTEGLAGVESFQQRGFETTDSQSSISKLTGYQNLGALSEQNRKN